jgi:hypothetical protein
VQRYENSERNAKETGDFFPFCQYAGQTKKIGVARDNADFLIITTVKISQPQG